jgi:hypothetical protein
VGQIKNFAEKEKGLKRNRKEREKGEKRKTPNHRGKG